MTRAAARDLDALVARIRACRVCFDEPKGTPLPHVPRPVLRVSPTARIAVCGQAPGIKVHESGVPFTDRSGDRLREWMGVTADEFYDQTRVSVVPMGFCFPGYDKNGGDLPPRCECAPLWRVEVMARLPRVGLLLAVGNYATRWHLPERPREPLTQTVAAWRAILERPGVTPPVLPLPHPSWRNNHWLKANPWFEADLLPVLRRRVRDALENAP